MLDEVIISKLKDKKIENTTIYFKGDLKCRKCKRCAHEYQIKYRSSKKKIITARTTCKKGHTLTEKCLIKKSCCQCIKIANNKYINKKRQEKRGDI